MVRVFLLDADGLTVCVIMGYRGPGPGPGPGPPPTRNRSVVVVVVTAVAQLTGCYLVSERLWIT